MLLFEWASLFDTVGYKLAEGKGLREGWDSKELWKSVEKSKAPAFADRESWSTRNSNVGDPVAPARTFLLLLPLFYQVGELYGIPFALPFLKIRNITRRRLGR